MWFPGEEEVLWHFSRVPEYTDPRTADRQRKILANILVGVLHGDREKKLSQGRESAVKRCNLEGYLPRDAIKRCNKKRFWNSLSRKPPKFIAPWLRYYTQVPSFIVPREISMPLFSTFVKSTLPPAILVKLERKKLEISATIREMTYSLLLLYCVYKPFSNIETKKKSWPLFSSFKVWRSLLQCIAIPPGIFVTEKKKIRNLPNNNSEDLQRILSLFITTFLVCKSQKILLWYLRWKQISIRFTKKKISSSETLSKITIPPVMTPKI